MMTMASSECFLWSIRRGHWNTTPPSCRLPGMHTLSRRMRSLGIRRHPAMARQSLSARKPHIHGKALSRGKAHGHRPCSRLSPRHSHQAILEALTRHEYNQITGFMKDSPAGPSMDIRMRMGYNPIYDEEERDYKSRLKFLATKEELYRIQNSDSEAEAVMQAILRHYTGVFADYVYIEETLLSGVTGLKNDLVYGILKRLNSNRVVSYIPGRRTPTIMFTCPRVDTERIYLSPMVYDARKKEYAKRIGRMIDYVSETNICRSKMLLAYFGEKF